MSKDFLKDVPTDLQWSSEVNREWTLRENFHIDVANLYKGEIIRQLWKQHSNEMKTQRALFTCGNRLGALREFIVMETNRKV